MRPKILIENRPAVLIVDGMFRPHWATYRWKLKTLPADAPRHLVKSTELRTATEDDASGIWTAMERSFASEQAWGMQLLERVRMLRKAVYDGLKDNKVQFIVVEHGRRIIAGSGLIKDAESPLHLATGVWVMEEYRCRGLGHFLLHASLKNLADAGLDEAVVVTRSNTAGAKYLYPKFDSTVGKLEEFPELKGLD